MIGTARACCVLPGLGLLMSLAAPVSVAAQGAWSKMEGLDVSWDVAEYRAGEIEILGWSWGAREPAAGARLAAAPGMPPPAGSSGDIVITKGVDSASAKLMQACAKGTHLDVVELGGPDALAGPSKERADQYFPGLSKYQSIKLSRAIVTSYSLTAAGQKGNTIPVETVTLHYERIDYEARRETPTPRVVGEPR
ncbi:MAG: type VI secretion system tube protein Hcp [Gemmatimonadota bacterium]